jgi:hypothetical protein
MTLQIKVEFGRMDHVPIDNRTSRAIATTVSLIGSCGEESYVVSLANDNDSDCWRDIKLFTRS